MPDAAVKISDLKVLYGQDTVLDVKRLELERGKIHVLVGPNGSGKTTLLRVIGGLERPASGRVEVFGQEIVSLPYRERLKLIRRMAFCFQKPYLFNKTVRRNVEYGLAARGAKRSQVADSVTAVMERLKVAQLQHRNAHTLSAGESRRVSLARAIVLEPELILLDEPVANVDQASVPLVESAVTALHSKGSTVVVATHVLEQAYRFSANVVRLERGRIAPPAIENLLEGEVVSRNSSAALTLAGGLEIQVVTEKRGPARAAVDPKAVIVSQKPLDSSARNSFSGRIVSLSESAGHVVLSIDIGIELTALITPESFKRLGVTLGSEVFLTFKATAVAVF